MKTKTTKEILESQEAEEFFDIQQDLANSEIPQEENIDYDRLKSWCATNNDTWLKLDDLEEFIKNFQSKKRQITDKILIQEELKELLLKSLNSIDKTKTFGGKKND